MEGETEVRDENDVISECYGKCWKLWLEKSYTPPAMHGSDQPANSRPNCRAFSATAGSSVKVPGAALTPANRQEEKEQPIIAAGFFS